MRSVHSILLLPIAFLGIILFRPSPVQATTHDGKPKILLHVRTITTKNVCQAGALVSCQEAVTQGSTNTFYNVYLLIAKGLQASTLGVRLGIDYQGAFKFEGGERPIDVFSWNHCGAQESSVLGWPSPGSGNQIIWPVSDCQSNEVAVAGYLYMAAYEPGFMRIIPNPVDQLLRIASCDQVGIELNAPSDAGYAWFSETGLPGCNPCNQPCQVVAVESTTWSRLKTSPPGR